MPDVQDDKRQDTPMQTTSDTESETQTPPVRLDTVKMILDHTTGLIRPATADDLDNVRQRQW